MNNHRPTVQVTLYGTGEAADGLARSILRHHIVFLRRAPTRGMRPRDLMMVVSWGKGFEPEVFYGEEKIKEGIATLPYPPAKLEKSQQPRPSQSSTRRLKRRGGPGFK